MIPRLITLTTDFGLKDPYVAEMKAVIFGLNPNARIVDITHEIEKFNICMGAYVLACASPYFPKGTIHVGVVDPGVGTQRRALLICTKRGFFIGPDNGLLVLAAKKLGIMHIYEIANPKFMLKKISFTFHGRDIFAPVAAHLAGGTQPSEFGPETQEIVIPKFADVVRKQNELIGKVLHVDDFGNIVTNLKRDDLEEANIRNLIVVEMKNLRLKLKICKTYAEAKAQQPLAIIGSHDFLEISVNQGNASAKFGLAIGDEVKLCLTDA